MRTKTLLLVAALSAAGVATSMAQVFSVNAVGYVNTKIPANTAGGKGKLALISNPLDAGAGNNTIANLFKGVPGGTQVYKYDSAKSTFITATYDDIDNAFGPADAAATEVKPGEGVFIRNTSTSDLTITFVGEVPQGQLDTTYPKGLSILSSQVPQSGTAADLGFKGANGDQIYQYHADTQAYTAHTYDDIDPAAPWGPALQPLAVGEAFFLKAAAGGKWSRTFSVNQ